jgi:hypothetical protein
MHKSTARRDDRRTEASQNGFESTALLPDVSRPDAESAEGSNCRNISVSCLLVDGETRGPSARRAEHIHRQSTSPVTGQRREWRATRRAPGSASVESGQGRARHCGLAAAAAPVIGTAVAFDR